VKLPQCGWGVPGQSWPVIYLYDITGLPRTCITSGSYMNLLWYIDRPVSDPHLPSK
jgi:hypothetical protein